MQASSEAQVSAAGEVMEPVATANTMPSQTILCRFTCTPQSVQRKDSAKGVDPDHNGLARPYDSGPIFDFLSERQLMAVGSTIVTRSRAFNESSGLPSAGNDDGFAERTLIFLLANRIHGPQLRQQVVDQHIADQDPACHAQMNAGT